MNIVLWILQVLLALSYAMAGSSKWLMPVEQMQLPPELNLAFMRFIGTCELLAVLGLILPSLLRIKPWLTPLAAALAVPIMIGAVFFTTRDYGFHLALLPLAVGIGDVVVAYGRWKLRPIASR